MKCGLAFCYHCYLLLVVAIVLFCLYCIPPPSALCPQGFPSKAMTKLEDYGFD
jgi:hypothetical protein